jgi:hypothetical protein
MALVNLLFEIVYFGWHLLVTCGVWKQNKKCMVNGLMWSDFFFALVASWVFFL